VRSAASPLLRAALAVAKSSRSCDVGESSQGIAVSFERETVLTVEQSGAGVLVVIRTWLGVHPRTSGKLTRLVSPDPEWEVAYTESEWHVRGLVAAVLDRLARRSTLESRLIAGLDGRIESNPIGRDSGDYWKALAEWGKKTERLSPADRHFAFLFGQKVERRIAPSEKFQRWASRTADQAEREGFQPPDR